MAMTRGREISPPNDHGRRRRARLTPRARPPPAPSHGTITAPQVTRTAIKGARDDRVPESHAGAGLEVKRTRFLLSWLRARTERQGARRTHGGAPPLDGRARHPAGELRPAGVGAPSSRRGRHRRAHPCRRPRVPRPRRDRRCHRRRLPLARLLPGPQPWDTCRPDCGGDGRGARLLQVAPGGEGQAVLRRPGQEDTAVHQLQRAQGDGAQLARLPPAALPSPRRVRARLAVQPARFQGHHEHVLQGSPGARVQAVRCDLGESGSRGELHEGDAGRAGAAHGSQLLPSMPGARAHLRPPGAHRSQRAYHPAHGPGRRRPAGAPRRQVGRRKPAARCAHRQHRRPAAGAEQRGVPECVAPRGGELGPGADVRGVVPVPVQPRRARPRAEARHGGHPGRVQELHVRRVLQEVLEQEPGPGALPGAVQNNLAGWVRANGYAMVCFTVFLHDIRTTRFTMFVDYSLCNSSTLYT